jgi:hypothetical protein
MTVNISGDTGVSAVQDNIVTADKIATGAITVADIPDGEITSAKLHTTLDLSSKTVTLNSPTITGTNQPKGLPMLAVAASDSFTINQNVTTKLPFNNVLLDTTNDYDTTNYRWVPSVAGYYQAYMTIHPDVANLTGVFYVRFYKNGGTSDSGIPGGTKIEYTQVGGAGGNNTNVRGMCYMYMNGTTDYMEFWAGHNIGSTRTIYGPTIYTYAQAHLIQAT